ncbi:retinol dehydrogenase 12 isoform X1 [Procambarus clarkii]|uniref:retinol dehydrogenase 12 isoform X1 n=1 Tax=Procambarus clarkii TaxID=6728 RepID=UPI00374337B1
MLDLVVYLVSWFVVPPWSLVGWASLGALVWGINRFRYPWWRSPQSMDGKTVVITGANKGIGLETARDLVGRGATVILACRSTTRAHAARDDIMSGGWRGKVEVAQLDVSSMASVRQFAKNLHGRKVDVLINNAAVADLPQQLTSDGHELTIATNHLGHFLLTHLLMQNLKEAGGRVVTVTSIGHIWVKDVKGLDLDGDLKFQLDRPLGTLEIYGASKAMNILFTKELDRKLSGTAGVTANCLHPGVVNTDIFKVFTSRVWYGLFVKLFVRTYAKSSTEGAQTSIMLAASDELKNVSGQYFQDCKIAECSSLVKDEGVAKKLWEISERLVQLQPHERTL